MPTAIEFQDGTFQDTAAIAKTASLSAALATNGCRIVGLVCPQMAATTAYLGVQVSLDGSTYAALYDEAGNIRKIAVSASAARYVELDSWLGRFPYYKFVASTDGSTGVAQDPAITLTFILAAS